MGLLAHRAMQERATVILQRSLQYVLQLEQLRLRLVA